MFRSSFISIAIVCGHGCVPKLHYPARDPFTQTVGDYGIGNRYLARTLPITMGANARPSTDCAPCQYEANCMDVLPRASDNVQICNPDSRWLSSQSPHESLDRSGSVHPTWRRMAVDSRDELGRVRPDQREAIEIQRCSASQRNRRQFILARVGTVEVRHEVRNLTLGYDLAAFHDIHCASR